MLLPVALREIWKVLWDISQGRHRSCFSTCFSAPPYSWPATGSWWGLAPGNILFIGVVLIHRTNRHAYFPLSVSLPSSIHPSVCQKREQEIVIYLFKDWLTWLWVLTSPYLQSRTAGWRPRGEWMLQSWIWRQSVGKMPSSLGNLDLLSRIFNWLDEAHQHYRG